MAGFTGGTSFCRNAPCRLSLDVQLPDSMSLNGYRQMIAPALVAQARGNRAAADAGLKHLLTETEIPQKNPYLIAEVYGFRGEFEQAFLWLERACAAHSQLFCLLLTDNLLESLHPDPRWQLLLDNLSLTAEKLK